MSEFIYPVQLMTTDQVLHLKQLTHKQHKNFVKVIINNDSDVFEIFVNNLISDLCVKKIDPSNLTNLDKLGILLSVRASNISPVGKFTIKEDKKVLNFELNINDIIKTISELDIKNTFKITDDAVTVTGTLPKKLAANNQTDLFTSCLSTVSFRDNHIDFAELTEEGRQAVTNKLPSFIFSDILKYIIEQDNIISSKPIVDIAGKEMRLSVVGPAIIDIVSLFYNADLKSFYDTEYTLMKHFNFSHDGINECTPGELMLYYSIISDEMKKQKEEQDKQSAGVPIRPK